MFRRMQELFGVGGPTIDTVLANRAAQPGGVLGGEVRITGGDNDRPVNQLSMSLAARVEVESGDDEYNATTRFATQVIAGQGVLPARVNTTLPFQLQVPWESPFNVLRGQVFHKMHLGLATRFDLPGGKDATDFDPIEIHPLPVHVQAIEALERMGFRMTGADLEKGRLGGSSLGFYNEVEFRGHGRIPECELTFITNPQQTHIVIEVDRQGFFSSSDRTGGVVVPTQGGANLDQLLGQRIDQLASGGRFFG